MPISTSPTRWQKGAPIGSVVEPGSYKIAPLTRSPRHGTHSLSPAWLEQYQQVRNQTTQLVAGLTPEDQMVQSMPDASPSKWHLAHTTWFFETFVLAPHLTKYISYDERFHFLFNSYYKRLGHHPDRATRGTFSRPTLDEVQAYRAYVDDNIRALLGRDASPEVHRLLELGLNHEQQHQELIVTDIKHAFWLNPLRPSYQPAKTEVEGTTEPPEAALTRSWCCFDGGIHHIGHDDPGFAFDNELPRHAVFIEPFCIASRLVTNREYLAFISDGGYHRPELWLSDAWDHVCRNGWTVPLYWEQAGNEWTQFTCGGTVPLNPAEPVCHISFYEADAFARWAGKRLPTEFEWEIAAGSLKNTSAAGANLLEGRKYHPRPAVHANPPQTGMDQVFGDTWEWTSSPYTAYPGYRPPAGAEGEYNGKFMCNQMVLRGGSCATPRSHIRKSYRNFFPPQTRWQFSGIRLAHDCARS
ncbi:ergothioneine biosynthesis protein EgtB [Nitrosospira sp. Is2]|uniref:ergothioneine biosynthesis protein EgtB n=1 Tax=Nitrosospira sp. Is2 TaxID=3080532 RepID=UPI002954F9A9|nr:ergothioneine biosynthesis protein EgtB [Nitrosospira sp. Is2]WON74433.1 ergothioneine biosynthesis protein EgtB [Nitrosospira sp. Is2]